MPTRPTSIWSVRYQQLHQLWKLAAAFGLHGRRRNRIGVNLVGVLMDSCKKASSAGPTLLCWGGGGRLGVSLHTHTHTHTETVDRPRALCSGSVFDAQHALGATPYTFGFLFTGAPGMRRITRRWHRTRHSFTHFTTVGTVMCPPWDATAVQQCSTHTPNNPHAPSWLSAPAAPL